MSPKLNLRSIQRSLETRVMGKTVLFLKEVDSTNSWAKRLACSGAQEGTIAIAKTQTCGRGRLEHLWYSPVGGLWFSVILRPKINASQAPQLTMLAGLSVTQTLRDIFNFDAQVKWPNDVLVNGKKICGILGEANSEADKVSFAVAGIGLNANFDVHEALPESVAASATSLQTEIGYKVGLKQLMIALLKRLEGNYDIYLNKGFSSILAEWKRYSRFIGHEVDVVDQGKIFKGTAEDVDEDGALMLRLGDGTLKHFLAADVSLRQRQGQTK
jgi:BirA family biotin operon repressor/biotin-[acetyl-CoA-carboxylase] ligase